MVWATLQDVSSLGPGADWPLGPNMTRVHWEASDPARRLRAAGSLTPGPLSKSCLGNRCHLAGLPPSTPGHHCRLRLVPLCGWGGLASYTRCQPGSTRPVLAAFGPQCDTKDQRPRHQMRLQPAPGSRAGPQPHPLPLCASPPPRAAGRRLCPPETPRPRGTGPGRTGSRTPPLRGQEAAPCPGPQVPAPPPGVVPLPHPLCPPLPPGRLSSCQGEGARHLSSRGERKRRPRCWAAAGRPRRQPPGRRLDWAKPLVPQLQPALPVGTEDPGAEARVCLSL